MNSSDHLTRRTFLNQTAKAGAAGWAAAHLGVLSGGVTTAAEPARPWQIGCYTRPWAKYDYRIALDAIAEAGYEYVGLMTTN